ncbi:MAG TPA: hypothetical protein PK089_05715, partial [Methanoregulaceae archaeon]|nr:hypothetical protein [Methanoregulaceae archaeon]HQJ88764.1 hypothetical protein [Methanoregulaceae archaeon]
TEDPFPSFNPEKGTKLTRIRWWQPTRNATRALIDRNGEEIRLFFNSTGVETRRGIPSVKTLISNQFAEFRAFFSDHHVYRVLIHLNPHPRGREEYPQGTLIGHDGSGVAAGYW